MKTQIKISCLLLMLSIGALMTPQKASAQEYVSYQVFYDELSPYGTWIDNPNYGYVWLPNVDPGFVPYGTNGYWAYTDSGWTWVSEYSWGWAPFHYGRWVFDAIYGPMWVPDYEWSPGWVVWRSSNDYYGWAPMGPGITYEVAYGNNYNVPYDNWTFVKNGDFGKTDIYNFHVNHINNVTIYKSTAIINNSIVDKTNNVKYYGGPVKSEVEKNTGKTYSPIAIKEVGKPNQNLTNNQLQIYKPKVQKTTTTGVKPTPTKVTDLKDVKTIKQRTAEKQPQKPNQATEQKQTQPQQNQPKKNEDEKPKK